MRQFDRFFSVDRAKLTLIIPVIILLNQRYTTEEIPSAYPAQKTEPTKEACAFVEARKPRTWYGSGSTKAKITGGSNWEAKLHSYRGEKTSHRGIYSTWHCIPITHH